MFNTLQFFFDSSNIPYKSHPSGLIASSIGLISSSARSENRNECVLTVVADSATRGIGMSREGARPKNYNRLFCFFHRIILKLTVLNSISEINEHANDEP